MTYKWTTSTTSTDEQKPVENQPQFRDESIPERLARINAQRSLLMEEEGILLEKGLNSYNPDVLIKAQAHWSDVQSRQSSGLKSTLLDPRELTDSLGYKNKPHSLSYQVLRRMSRIPLIRSIISTRQSQVSAFARPQSDRFSTGFVIRKRREYYATEQSQKITKEDQNEIRRITDFLLNGGDDSNKWHGDNFEMFLKKLVDDSLSLDQGTFEVVRNNKGIPVEYLATDGATFRIASTYDDDEGIVRGKRAEKKMGYLPSFVQVIEQEVVEEYYPWELCFGVRNLSSDIYRNGYGRSELEDLIEIVTYMVSADTYNGKFFTQGSNPKGIIKISGNVNTNRLAEFRQQWQSMVSGVMNAWKIPVLESDKMDWIDLQKSNVDMQFSTWQEYLLKVACSCYKIAPEELGFSVGNASSGGSMFESGAESRLKYSRDKGLIPLLKTLEYWINRWLVQPLNEDFEFAFTGYDVDGKEKELELDIKMVGSFVGHKEMREKWGYKRDFAEDDFPLNNAWIQRISQVEMTEQQNESTEFVDDEMDEEDEDYSMWEEAGLEKGEISENPMQNDLKLWWKNNML